jgi:membrane associated rhomboid family serine protease
VSGYFTYTIGASGAVFGILLAFGMMFPNQYIILLFPPIPIKAKYFVGIYGGIELLSGLTRPDSGVAHFAHLGGLVVGFILIKYWKIKRPVL